ncbi:MAG: hypothetical protein Q7R83_04330 [bacterium]|nr:hypothetical protein [bacterium]
MNPRTKRILILVLFLLFIVGIGYLLYRSFFAPEKPATIPAGQQPTTGQLPSAGKAVVSAIPQPGEAGLPSAGSLDVGGQPSLTIPPPPAPPSRSAVLLSTPLTSISADPGGNGLRGFDPNDGKFYRVNPDGTKTALSEQKFYGVNTVTWGNRTDKAILTYPDGSKTLYDFQKDKQSTLPSYWDGFSFAPDDTQIASKSIGNNETNRWLVVANPDGSEAKRIEPLGINQDKVMINWSPNNQMIAFAFTGEPTGYDRQSIILVGQNHENFRSLEVEGRGLVPNWSPSGNNLLYSVYSSNDGYRPRLWVSAASGDNINANRRDLGLLTWADKCAWQTETVLVCAVPTELEEGSALQRSIASNVPDTIYKIDLKNGTKINLGSPTGNPTINTIVLSPDGKSLYYTDFSSGNTMSFSL